MSLYYLDAKHALHLTGTIKTSGPPKSEMNKTCNKNYDQNRKDKLEGSQSHRKNPTARKRMVKMANNRPIVALMNDLIRRMEKSEEQLVEQAKWNMQITERINSSNNSKNSF